MNRVGAQERSQETGNDSRGKRLFHRADRRQHASIREKTGGKKQKTPHPVKKRENKEESDIGRKNNAAREAWKDSCQGSFRSYPLPR